MNIGVIADAFCKRYPVDITLSPEDINIIDGYVGEGYGLAFKDQATAMYYFARLEGIILNPVYTGKAFLV
jgi:D-cysteine desulfhydrase